MEGEMVIQSAPEISSRSWFSIWFEVLTNPKEQTFQNLLKEKDRGIIRSLSWLMMSHVGVRLAIVGYYILSEEKLGSFKDIFLKFYLPDLLSTESKENGSFKNLLFMYAAYQAPLNIFFSLLYAVPAGECVSFLISLYVILLSVIALKFLYGISTVKAGIVVIISSVLAMFPYNILATSLLRV
jgi:hypothetical protein